MNGKPFVHIHSRIAEFGKLECEHYPRENRDAFALAVSQVQRYEFFLRMILRRHDETATDFASCVLQLQAHKARLQESVGPGPYELAPTESQLINNMDNLSPYIQLDSESFYLFAKIMLDRISKFLEDHFRPAPGEKHLVKGYTFAGSHNTLTEKFGAFAATRKLFLPPAFLPLARELREKVSGYRDKQITHNHNMRMLHATAFSVDGSVPPRMMKAPMRAKDWEAGGKQVESIAIHVLMSRVDAYLDALFTLLVANREHSGWMRVAPPMQSPGQAASYGE